MHKQKPSERSQKNNGNFYSVFPWFPYPSAWLKSLVLVILAGVIVRGFEQLGIGKFIVINSESPERMFFLITFSFLSPIVAIAFTHHWFHSFLNKVAPSIQAPEIVITQGSLPDIISWWEGLYAWIVIFLSTLLAFNICILFFPVFDISLSLNPASYDTFQDNIINIFGVLWIVHAALLYHFEAKVKQRVVSAYCQKK
jgi:hypothetical protein